MSASAPSGTLVGASQMGVWSTVESSSDVLLLPPAAGFTVKLSFVVRSTICLVRPWIVTVAGPVVAVADAVSVKVEVLYVWLENTAVTPLGNPVAVSTTPRTKPLRVMVTRDVPLVPC